MHIQVNEQLSPYLEELKKTMEEYVLMKVMSTWFKIHDLQRVSSSGAVPTRAQAATSRKYIDRFEVRHVTDLIDDKCLLEAMLWKEWHVVEKISTTRSFSRIQI